MSHFGDRLRTAFHNAKNAEIARKLGVTESAVKNYVEGRIPDAERLIVIANLTGCDLHWLLTGNELIRPSADEEHTFEEIFEAKVRAIVRDELREPFDAPELESNIRGELKPAPDMVRVPRSRQIKLMSEEEAERKYDEWKKKKAG